MSDAALTIRGIYAILDRSLIDGDQLAPLAEAVIGGGATIIQYRDKVPQERARREREASLLVKTCNKYGAICIINDDVQLAASVGAHGVHVGGRDMGPAEARAIVGYGAVVGVSCYNEISRAAKAVKAGADYIAFGSFFASRTKPDAVRAELGLLREARRRYSVPIVAIGGITPTNARDLIDAGASAIAVISGIFCQPDPRAASACYTALFSDRREFTHRH